MLNMPIGGVNLIQAVLEGKSLGYEYREDILTSTVFGTLKYIRPDMVLIPFIESAFLYDEKRTTLGENVSLLFSIFEINILGGLMKQCF